MNFLAIIFLSFVFEESFGQDTRSYKEFLNKVINPCEDFYEYACGKWKPLNSDTIDVITDQRLENKNTIKDHFKSLRQKGIRSEVASEFYNLCLNSKYQSEDEILQTHLDALVEISEWPYLNETFDPSIYDWMKVAAKLRQYKVETLFKLTIQTSWKDSRQQIIYLTPLKKPFDGSADGDEAFMYKTYIKYLLLGFGVRVRKANMFAQEVVDFEVELDNLNRFAEDVLIEPITLDSLVAQFPGTKWKLYFEILLGRPLKQSQRIVVQKGILTKLETLLKKTKPETIALYQLTKFLRHYEVKMDPPEWIDCIDEVNTKFPLSISKIFTSLRGEISSSKIINIFENIQNEFLHQINETEWYDAKTKEEVMNKLKAISIRVGYPEIRSQENIIIDGQNYQQVRMELDKKASKLEFDQLTKNSVGPSKNLRPLNVNAYYKLTGNILEIPIGLLQPPMYTEGSNIAQIMGSLGSIIAHELVHGFDYDGQNYDLKGNVLANFNPKAIVQFGLRANCFIDQYGGGHVIALNEDIADNEGMRLAYGAYEGLRGDHPYVGSDITGDQLFFISFAQIWCRSKGTSSRPRDHSSHKDRVNNVVANSEKFGEAFSCRRGSNLNPVKKCQIW